MQIRRFSGAPGEVARALNENDPLVDGHWLWIDVEADGESAVSDVEGALDGLGFDEMAVSDSVGDSDLPKLDDFGEHLLIVIHGIADQHMIGPDDDELTVEIDCFLTESMLVTVHRHSARSIDTFARQIQRTPELSLGGPSEVLGRIADVISRRFLILLDELDDRVELLSSMALRADPDYLEHLTVARDHVGELRHVLRPQREVFDQLRRSVSPVLTDGARRRFSDVYDHADRSVKELETARSALSDTLGAYQGAEAREATEVTKVLTIYAAIMLPLSLIAGVFGMNFDDNPWGQSDIGFWIVMGVMVTVAVVSLVLFAVAGWIRPPRVFRAPTLEPLRGFTTPPVELAASVFKRAGKTLNPRRVRRTRSPS